ncbi:MAG: MFS transporter [Microthrixaceae bacterium]
MDTEQRTTLWIVLAVTVAMQAGNGTIFGLIAEIQDTHGISTGQLGLISSALFATSLFSALGLAHYADKGHARRMMIVGLAIGDIDRLVRRRHRAVAVHRRPGLCGLGVGMFLAAGRSSVARLSTTRAGQNLGMMVAAETTGFVFGPTIAVLLFKLGSLSTPFFVLAAIQGLALVFLLTRHADVEAKTRPTPLPMWKLSGLDLLSRPKVLGAALLGLAMYLPVGVYEALWSRYLTDLGASTTFVGASLTLYGVPLALLAGFGGRLVDRDGAIPVAKRTLAMLVPIVILYGLVGSYWAVALVAMVESVVQATANPSAQKAMVQACPPDRIGNGQGLTSAFGLAGAGLLSSVAPWVYAELGSGWLFGIVGVMCAVLATIAFSLYSRGESLVGVA